MYILHLDHWLKSCWERLSNHLRVLCVEMLLIFLCTNHKRLNVSSLSTSALQKDIRETLCNNGLHCWQQCYWLELQVGGVSLSWKEEGGSGWLEQFMVWLGFLLKPVKVCWTFCFLLYCNCLFIQLSWVKKDHHEVLLLCYACCLEFSRLVFFLR